MCRIALLPLFVFVFACSDNALVQPQDYLAVAAADHVTKMVPLEGTGTWWVVGFSYGCEGDPDNLVVHGAGELNLLHLGVSKWSFSNCTTPGFDALISQTATVTAANGDELFWYGSADMGNRFSLPTPTTWEMGPMWFVGGTGRFEGATGELHAWGETTVDITSGTIEVGGMISSVGSTK